MSRHGRWLLALWALLLLLVAPGWSFAALPAGESGERGGWYYPLLWAIGFNGQNTGRTLLILLAALAVATVFAIWAVRRVRKELRSYAARGRGALIDARSRWDRIAEKVRRGEPSPELGLESFLRDEDPMFELVTFKRDHLREFADARKLTERHVTAHLTDARRRGNDLIATLRFESESIAEDWTYSKPRLPGAAWNVIEEHVIRPAA